VYVYNHCYVLPLLILSDFTFYARFFIYLVYKKNTFYGLYYSIPHETFTTTIITDKIGRWGWCEKEEEEGDRERSS
jgi:hypothetical protein